MMCTDKNNDKNNDYFVLQTCSRWVEKNFFFNCMDFNPLRTKMKENIQKGRTKVFLQKGH